MKVLYVTEVYPDPSRGLGVWGGGEKQFYEVTQRVSAAGVEATTALIEQMGTPVGAAILRHAEDWPADLIVCGTHGRRGVR
ncbi:MAG: universal stress protein, partial [Nitrososphaerota archaeon]|nr:universal stress protein [Nitrososphaerota archaeon]